MTSVPSGTPAQPDSGGAPVSRSDRRIGLSVRPAFVGGSDVGGKSDASSMSISSLSRLFGKCSNATELLLAIAGADASGIDFYCSESLFLRAKAAELCRNLDTDINVYNPELTDAALRAVDSLVAGDGKLALPDLLCVVSRMSTTAYFRDRLEQQHLSELISVYAAKELEGAMAVKEREAKISGLIDCRALLAVQKGEAELQCLLMEQKVEAAKKETAEAEEGMADMQQQLNTVTAEAEAAKKETAEAEQQLNTVTAELDGMRQQLNTVTAESEAAKKEAAAAEEEKADMQQQLNTATSELDGMRQQLNTVTALAASATSTSSAGLPLSNTTNKRKRRADFSIAPKAVPKAIESVAAPKAAPKAVVLEDSDTDAADAGPPPLLVLGDSSPLMQRQSKMCPRVREHARDHADKMLTFIKPLLLHPQSPVIGDIQQRKTRDNTLSTVLYAVYRRSDETLLKVGMASTLKTRKELGYNDDEDVVIRMIFRVDGMPDDMDSAVAGIYHEFWDAVRDDPKVEGYYKRLAKLVRDDGAGGLGIDKKLVSGLLEYAVQRTCGVAAPLECLTCDAQVLAQRKSMVIGVAKAAYHLIDDVLGPYWLLRVDSTI